MNKPTRRVVLISPVFLFAASLVAVAALPVRGAAHIARPAASCGCSLKANAYASVQATNPQPGDLPDMRDMTPQERFNAFLDNFQAAMDAKGVNPSALQFSYPTQIVYTPSSGLPLVMSFGSDGYLSMISSGQQAIRYHHNGVGAYGYDIKDPDGGYLDFTTILSTQWNDDGYILSSTWHPTGETTTYNPPPPASSTPPDGGTSPGGGGAVPIGGIVAGSLRTALQPQQTVSQTQQAAANFNDRERTIKNNRKNCNAAALNGYWQCLGTAGVAVTVASGLAGGGLGAAIGAPGGPAGIAGGASTGVLIGTALGGSAAVAGCVANAIAQTNQCTATYRNDTNNNIAQYNADIARAASNPRSN